MLINSLKSMEHVMLTVISFEQILHDVTVVFKRTHLFAACYISCQSCSSVLCLCGSLKQLRQQFHRGNIQIWQYN